MDSRLGPASVSEVLAVLAVGLPNLLDRLGAVGDGDEFVGPGAADGALDLKELGQLAVVLLGRALDSLIPHRRAHLRLHPFGGTRPGAPVHP